MLSRGPLALGLSLLVLFLPAAFALATAQAAADNLDTVTQISVLPARLGGVAAGVIVGTPLAVVRESYKSYLDLTGAGAEQIHAKDCAPVCLLISAITLPAGVVLGSFRGGFYGVKNGVVRGFQTPFNSRSFSLGELDE